MTAPAKNSTLILWAIDPFADDLSLQRSAAWVLKDLASRGSVRIQPVYLEAKTRLVFTDLTADEGLVRLQSRAREFFSRLTRTLRMKSVLPLEVIAHAGDTQSDKAAALFRFAADHDAQLVVTSTRARRGPARWLLGSFAETLSLLPGMPLLLVNPKWDHRSSFNRIYFATDFSETSRLAYVEMLKLAGALDSELVLFHSLNHAPAPAFDFGAATQKNDRRSQKLDQDWADAQGKLWVDTATHAGVKAKLVVARGTTKMLPDALFSLTNKRPGIIALCANSTRFEIALLGSFARQIVRGAPCPVWILRPTPEVSTPLWSIQNELLTHKANAPDARN